MQALPSQLYACPVAQTQVSANARLFCLEAEHSMAPLSRSLLSSPQQRDETVVSMRLPFIRLSHRALHPPRDLRWLASSCPADRRGFYSAATMAGAR